MSAKFCIETKVMLHASSIKLGMSLQVRESVDSGTATKDAKANVQVRDLGENIPHMPLQPTCMGVRMVDGRYDGFGLAYMFVRATQVSQGCTVGPASMCILPSTVVGQI